LEQRAIKQRRERKPRYSKREIRQMLRSNSCPIDAPKSVHDELEQRRKKMNREAKNPHNEFDDFAWNEYGAVPYIPVRDGSRFEIITSYSRRGGLVGLVTKFFGALKKFIGDN